MGPPDKVEELGETEIPEDVLTDYLFDLSPQFTSVHTTHYTIIRIMSSFILCM